jgi:hypothetical protein
MAGFLQIITSRARAEITIPLIVPATILGIILEYIDLSYTDISLCPLI